VDSTKLRALLEPGGFEIQDGELLIERECWREASHARCGQPPGDRARSVLAPHLGDITDSDQRFCSPWRRSASAGRVRRHAQATGGNGRSYRALRQVESG
jgi:hypothetical protein